MKKKLIFGSPDRGSKPPDRRTAPGASLGGAGRTMAAPVVMVAAPPRATPSLAEMAMAGGGEEEVAARVFQNPSART